MAQKPSIPKGTRDFNPVEASRRNYIFDTIRNVFKEFGYATKIGRASCMERV